ncbi:hypothetical protein GFL78_11905 [Rhizobium leguminosarum bv. viciae]|nr:hypothetical protein [Rhizobium leguminosarum]NKL12657.1 hypothetical protein [Rhizobium leguminosarum bv. viciae]NKL41815.1 hypothetical protein [Rhizobium leguminosarum bv. viciae]
MQGSHVWEQQLPRLVPMSDSAEDPLLPGAEWNPYVHAVRGFSNGVAPDPMSAADYLAYEQRAAIAIGERRRTNRTLISARLPSTTAVRLATPDEGEHRYCLTITITS